MVDGFTHRIYCMMHSPCDILCVCVLMGLNVTVIVSAPGAPSRSPLVTEPPAHKYGSSTSN